MADKEIIREWINKAEDDFHGLQLLRTGMQNRLTKLPTEFEVSLGGK